MAALRYGRLHRLIGFVVFFLLLSSGGLMLWHSGASAQTSLDLARERWAGRPFTAYRLLLMQQAGSSNCEQEIEAEDEQRTQMLRNSCGQPASWTVTRLFNWIAELERTPARCYPGPAMCACQITTTTRVIYDEELGYPRQIMYEWRKRPHMISPSYWRSLFDQSFPGCGKDGTGGPVVVNVKLAPEP